MPPILRLSNLSQVRIEENDAGIILKPDGSVRVFTTGEIDGNNLTPAQQEQGERLAVIMAVLGNNALFTAIYNQLVEAEAAGEDLLDLGKPN
jgi:hypothetical protein